MNTTLSSTPHGWCFELDRDWDVLGPFPVHAREQHFLSPAYPLDLSSPIETTTDLTKYPTSLTHTAYASWSRTTADPHGTILVSHPSAPWDQIRATEGWAGLQHTNVLRGWLSVYPPSSVNSNSDAQPFLRTELLQGAFFTVLPPPDSPERRTHVPEWHSGNVYTLERPPNQLVRLPVLPAAKGTRYEVIICGAYEIRLFGDPKAYSSPYPILTLNFSIALQFPCVPTSSLHHVENAPVQHVPAHSVTPHIVDGTPFGRAIGVGVQCLDFGHQMDAGQGSWSVISARVIPGPTALPPSLSLELLDGIPVHIVPTQTRIIPLLMNIAATERVSGDVKELNVELICVPSSSSLSPKETASGGQSETGYDGLFVLTVSLPITHVSMWTEDEHAPIHATYFYAGSMPTIFVVKPPNAAFGNVASGEDKKTNECRGNEPILALHGAGVDIILQSFWADALPRQKYAWIVMPQGRTAWGLDWHGPSSNDAFAAVSALSNILSTSGDGRWVKWGFGIETRVVLMGHSNGGQGAWYMASRMPDRVCAVVPAAGYIKSQAYVSWSMSRFAHFIDPALRAILDSSLTPDDNDLFLGNLVGKLVLALHGGTDDNVPTWQTREQVGILKAWDPDADVTYHEDPGQPHWYPDVLSNEHVQAFLDRVYFSKRSYQPLSFTLTVAVPAESGSMNGWRIHTLTTPGMLGRLQVRSSEAPGGRVEVRTTNVSVFSLDHAAWGAMYGRERERGENTMTVLTIDGEEVQIHSGDSIRVISFSKDVKASGLQHKSTWRVLPPISPVYPPYQRLRAILNIQAPLALLVPTLKRSAELSAALRIAHMLQLFHALDAQILSIRDICGLGTDVADTHATGIRGGNLVVIGCANEPIVQGWLARIGSAWTFVDGTWHFHGQKFDRPSSAILFLQPSPFNSQGLSLFVQSTDTRGLERAVRLFPIRTGVLAPDWIVVDDRADGVGAAGVQGAGVYGTNDQQAALGQWVWNERLSWVD